MTHCRPTLRGADAVVAVVGGVAGICYPLGLLASEVSPGRNGLSPLLGVRFSLSFVRRVCDEKILPIINHWIVFNPSGIRSFQVATYRSLTHLPIRIVSVLKSDSIIVV